MNRDEFVRYLEYAARDGSAAGILRQLAARRTVVLMTVCATLRSGSGAWTTADARSWPRSRTARPT
jgi:hypothetical protein